MSVIDAHMQKHLGQGTALTYGLRGADEALFRAADVRDANGLREAAALYYQRAMCAAALIDQVAGHEPAQWSTPDEPDEYPPTLLHQQR